MKPLSTVQKKDAASERDELWWGTSNMLTVFAAEDSDLAMRVVGRAEVPC